MNWFNFIGGDSIESKVNACIEKFERNDIQSLQYSLYELYSEFNRPGGGRKIIDFNHKDRLCECFIMMLNHDWIYDSDIREVWAENGFYCIVKYLKNDAKTMQDTVAAALNLFLLIEAGERNLYPKFNDILRKAAIRMKIVGGRELEIFYPNDIEGGAAYVLRQFKFFAATLLSRVVREHPQIISPSLRPAFEKAKNDFEFATIPMDKLIEKMDFFASIIGSILEDM